MSDPKNEIKFGKENPFHGEPPIDKAEEAVLGILSDLADRRGIKHELANCDDDVKKEIVKSLASIVREVYGSQQEGVLTND